MTDHCDRDTGSWECCIRCSSWSSSRQTAETSAEAPTPLRRQSHACDLLKCCQSRHGNTRPSPTPAILSVAAHQQYELNGSIRLQTRGHIFEKTQWILLGKPTQKINPKLNPVLVPCSTNIEILSFQYLFDVDSI